MLPADAQKLIADNVCARCYGDLKQRHVFNKVTKITDTIVECPACQDAWNGATIRRATAEAMGRAALATIAEIKANLPDLYPPAPRQSVRQNLSELGF